MSYEGYTEFLCRAGHYDTCDAYADGPKACRACSAPFAFSHGVDVTNGYSRHYSYSCEAKKVEIGFDDIWHTDHHGNRYATKLIRYEPRGKAWRPLRPGEKLS